MIEPRLRARLLGLLAAGEHLDRRSANAAIAWIRRCETPYRLRKPDVPNMHLAVYAIIRANDSFLLVNHSKARAWIPVGGHLEPGELPADAIDREVREELGIRPRWIARTPFIVTCKKVADGEIEHTDVTFWHLVDVDPVAVGERTIDAREELRWFPRDAIRGLRDIVGLSRAIDALTRSPRKSRCKAATRLQNPHQANLNLQPIAE